MPTRKEEEAPEHTVEERIRVIFVYLETLKQVATMVDESNMPAPGFDTRQEFAEWTIRMAEATAQQVALMEASICLSCLAAEAPGKPVSRK